MECKYRRKSWIGIQDDLYLRPWPPRVPRSQDILLFFPISDDKKCLRFQGIMFLSSTLVS